MKCSTHGVQEILLVRDVPDLLFCRARVDHRENAIVGSDEILAGHFGKNRTPFRPDAGIDHDHVHRLLREVSVCLGNDEGAFVDLERLHFVRDVDDLRPWRDAENHALHDADKMVYKPEIRGQSDGWSWHD